MSDRKTIQISKSTHKHLVKMSKEENKSIKDIIQSLVEQNAKATIWCDYSEEQQFKNIPFSNKDYNNFLYKHLRSSLDAELDFNDYHKISDNVSLISEHWNKTAEDYLGMVLQITALSLMQKFYKNTSPFDSSRGFTYISLTKDKNIYKIGYSKNPIRRTIKDLDTKPLFFIKGDCEQYLLSYYSNNYVGFHQLLGAVESECRMLTKYDIHNIYIGLRDTNVLEWVNNELFYHIVDYMNNNKTLFRPLTDTIKNIYIPAQNSENAKKWAYSTLLDLANKKAIGLTAREYKKEHNISTKQIKEEGKISIRDYMTAKELDRIKKMEEHLNGLILYAGITDYQELKNRLEDY